MRVFTTNKRLRDRLDNYANLLWTADAKLKDLTAENDKLKAENDKLKTENSTLQSASAKKINNLQKVIKQKQEKIENQRDNLSILLDFYLNSENALSVKRKIAGLRHRIEFLESESGLKTRSVEGENDDWNIAQCPHCLAETVDTHPSVQDLPTLSDLKGINFDTGGLDSVDFVRKIRDEW